MITRRRFVSISTAVALSGCTGNESSDSGGSNDGGSEAFSDEDSSDSDGDGVSDLEDDYPNDSTRSTLLDRGSETYDLNEDYYQYLEFSPTQSATLSYDVEVQNDIRIDVILTDGTNFRYFEDGTDWEYYGEGSELDTIHASNEMHLGIGREYYLIIDNTDEGRAAPPANLDNDRVEVEVSYELYS